MLKNLIDKLSAKKKNLSTASAQAGGRSKLRPCLVNSHGSSGTHMVLRLIELAGLTRPENDRYVPYDSKLDKYPPGKVALENLENEHECLVGAHWPYHVTRRQAEGRFSLIRPGEYSWGHIPYTDCLSEILSSHGMGMIFITREPRDWAVSAARHRLGHWDNVKFQDPRFPSSRMPYEEELLQIHVFGTLPETTGLRMLPIDQRYKIFSRWRNDPSALHVTFEDLVGASGGGVDSISRENIKRILEHLGADTSKEMLDNISSNLFQPFRPTENRRGLIGAWQKHKEFFDKPEVAELINAATEV